MRFVVVGNDSPAPCRVRHRPHRPSERSWPRVSPRAPRRLPSWCSRWRRRPCRGRHCPRNRLQGDRVSGFKDWLISGPSTVMLGILLLDRFSRRALNLHPGVLPEYARLQTRHWAIRNRETKFGVTVNPTEVGINTGDIIVEQRFEVRPTDTGLSLFNRCIKVGAALPRPWSATSSRGRLTGRDHRTPGAVTPIATTTPSMPA